MNPRSTDHPDLTTYALGELSPEQEQQMRDWLAAEPHAQGELADIERITEALHRGSHIPMDHLTPRQRLAVLTPPKGPRILTPMMPRQPIARRESRLMPILGAVLKIAAVGAVTTGAFMLGRQIEIPSGPALAAKKLPVPGDSKASATPLKSEANVPISITKPQAPGSGIASAEIPPKLLSSNESPTKQAAPEVRSAPSVPVIITAKSEVSKVANANRELIGYTATGRTPVSRVELRPFETRPVPVKSGGVALASPMTAGPAIGQKTDKGRSPELFIHSWKAEIASCPWNADHKLMRVLVQLPADQLASTSPTNIYPLQIAFDSFTVRSYRLLSESHVPPEAGTNAAAHVMWYEIVPNSPAAEPNRENGRSVATVSLPNARFSSQAVGPFDSSKLQALDRGQKWENAREDFLFETAIVGFGLLLRGEDNLGSLNHELVLKLAEKSQGPAKTNDERAKFIRLVQEAKRVTGI